MAENGPNLRNLSQGAEKNGPGPAGITPRLGQIVCGNIDMRIDNQGLWHYQGSPIGRIQLVKLFSTVLRRDNVGDHWLITPVEMCRIQVDDAAFMAVELTQTGFLSNRGRQIFASIWINDLNLDWRSGAEFFESYLIDYDVYSNYGNWMYLAGVGVDSRGKRHFNIEKQLKSYDPSNEYIKTWSSLHMLSNGLT